MLLIPKVSILSEQTENYVKKRISLENARKSCITEIRVINRTIHALARPKTAHIRERVVNRTIF